jgi:hypothetical protein
MAYAVADVCVSITALLLSVVFPYPILANISIEIPMLILDMRSANMAVLIPVFNAIFAWALLLTIIDPSISAFVDIPLHKAILTESADTVSATEVNIEDFNDFAPIRLKYIIKLDSSEDDTRNILITLVAISKLIPKSDFADLSAKQTEEMSEERPFDTETTLDNTDFDDIVVTLLVFDAMPFIAK